MEWDSIIKAAIAVGALAATFAGGLETEHVIERDRQIHAIVESRSLNPCDPLP